MKCFHAISEKSLFLKFLLIMKLTSLLILVLTFSVSARSFSQNKINFQVKRLEIASAISAIEKQTDYRFLYNENLEGIRQKVSVSLSDASIEEAMTSLLKNTDLTFQILDNKLIVISDNSGSQVDQVVKGTVKDEQGEPLIGVSVKIKGTTQGASTDVNGRFSIQAPENSTLVFTYIGYATKEVKIGTQTEITVILSAAKNELNEVVVVGYGTQKRAQVATAVSSVQGDAISSRGTVAPMQAVQGQVAGVDIRSSSGRAGAGFDVTIRGQNSLAGGSPLFVVDGVIVNNIDFLNPQDIEKMDVLKDAASTAVYGSRGSNGVVQVTTKGKSAVKGGSVISYDGYVGIRNNSRMPDFMTGDQWWEYRQDAYITPELLKTPQGSYDNTVGGVGQSPILAEIIQNKQYTDWRDLVLQTGVQANHWLTIAGQSSDRMNYMIGAGYQNEKGNLVKEFFKQYNFKASIDHRLNDKWSAGTSFNFSLAQQERGSNLAVTNAFRMAPVVPAYDESGNLKFRPGQFPGLSMTSSVNPLLDNANSENNTRKSFGLANLYLQFSPQKWLDLRTTFAPSISFSRNGIYNGSQTEARGGLLPSAQLDNQQNFSYIWDNVVTARKTVKEDHSFEFTGLFSLQRDRIESSFIKVRDLPFNSSFYNVGTAGVREQNESAYSERSLMSFMTRLNYSFKNKYVIGVVNRWDGSSMLSEGQKWASFPSASFAWRMKEEPFLKDVSGISELKLRVSAGKAGNNNGISPYETQANIGSPTLYDFGGTLASAYSPSRLANPNVSWEKTREYNLGVDYGFLKGRISGSIDVYDKLSSGLLMAWLLPYETGWTSIKANVGSVKNKGVELSLRTINVSKQDFNWTTTFNFARNKNQIEELFGKKEDVVGSKWFIGEPININYTYVFDGIWQESERAAAKLYGQLPGQARVKDLNNDGKIGPEDKQIIGQIDPKWTGGFSTTLNYKRFDFSASLFTRQGMQVLSSFHQEFTNLADRGRAKLNVNYYMSPNTVTPTRQSNEYPQPANVGPYWSSVGYYKDNSFVKVQNISLGYSLPNILLEKIKLKSLRLYANILNPFVFTDYEGFDPEYASESLNNTGVSTTTYQFGINAKF